MHNPSCHWGVILYSKSPDSQGPPADFFAALGPSTDKAVVDICSYKKPDLSVIDASVGLKGSHLSGRTIKPGLILASFDPVAVDAAGSRLLGHNPAQLEYLRLADGLLGSMQNSELIEA